MFDRGLLAISDTHEIIVAKNAAEERALERLIVPNRRLIVPQDPIFQPHPAYLKWHRENVFKG